MAAAILVILAGLTLVVTIWNFFRQRTSGEIAQQSDYLKSAADKLRGVQPSSKNNLHRWFQSRFERRRDYYINEYLKSDAWKRKRYVVLRRDNWRCVFCGGLATQVHHKRYAKKNIGREPIEWLVSVCKSCHELQHQKSF